MTDCIRGGNLLRYVRNTSFSMQPQKRKRKRKKSYVRTPFLHMESSTNRRHTLTQTPFLRIFRNVVELSMPSQYDIFGLVLNRVFTTSTVCGYLWCIFLPTTHSHNCRQLYHGLHTVRLITLLPGHHSATWRPGHAA